MKKYFAVALSLTFLAAGCAQTPTDQTTKPNTEKKVYVEWTQKKLPNGQYDEPFTQVGLQLTGSVSQTIDLGKFSSCVEKPEAKQITSLSCWWAGAGDDLYVLNEKPDEIKIMHQPTGELPEGAKPLPAEVLKTISIPVDSQVMAKNIVVD